MPITAIASRAASEVPDVVEDLHAADISLEALEYIVRRLGSAPILIVGTYRVTEITARHPLSHSLERALRAAGG